MSQSDFEIYELEKIRLKTNKTKSFVVLTRLYMTEISITVEKLSISISQAYNTQDLSMIEDLDRCCPNLSLCFYDFSSAKELFL